MFRDAMLKLLLAETLPYAKLVQDCGVYAVCSPLILSKDMVYCRLRLGRLGCVPSVHTGTGD
jgi:hypothetical protein